MPRIRTAAALAAAAALLFTGCASSSSPASTDSAAADDTFPITITHALGETTIPSKPERVAAVGGVIEAGPDGAGRFRVRVEVPTVTPIGHP